MDGWMDGLIDQGVQRKLSPRCGGAETELLEDKG
jgi:hypothetical protein